MSRTKSKEKNERFFLIATTFNIKVFGIFFKLMRKVYAVKRLVAK